MSVRAPSESPLSRRLRKRCGGGKTRAQDEDEMASSHKYPRSCFLLFRTMRRSCTPWSTLNEASSQWLLSFQSAQLKLSLCSSFFFLLHASRHLVGGTGILVHALSVFLLRLDLCRHLLWPVSTPGRVRSIHRKNATAMSTWGRSSRTPTHRQGGDDGQGGAADAVHRQGVRACGQGRQ